MKGGIGKLLVIMVGLPMCGKSFMASALQKYLRWLGYRVHSGQLTSALLETSPTATPGAGDTASPAGSPPAPLGARRSSSYSDFDKVAYNDAERDGKAMDLLNRLLKWLSEEGNNVAIHDAGNCGYLVAAVVSK